MHSLSPVAPGDFTRLGAAFGFTPHDQPSHGLPRGAQRREGGGGNTFRMKYGLKRPCIECPFRVASLPGWLGPDTGDAAGMINGVAGRHEIAPGVFIGCEPANIACHKDASRLGRELDLAPDEAIPSEYAAEVQHCAGALLFLKTSCKLPRDREKIAAMDRVKAFEPMLRNVPEFLAHHGPQTKPAPARRAKKEALAK